MDRAVSDYEPDWYDSHCPTCDAPEPTHTPSCAVPKRGGRGMTYRCEYCDSESESVSAMLACEESCAEDQLHQRQVWANFNPHRKD